MRKSGGAVEFRGAVFFDLNPQHSILGGAVEFQIHSTVLWIFFALFFSFPQHRVLWIFFGGAVDFRAGAVDLGGAVFFFGLNPQHSVFGGAVEY